MSYHQLDNRGKPIPKKNRSRRDAAMRMESGVPHYHYEIYVSIPLPDGKRRQVRQRCWLPDDLAAASKERELRREGPGNALTWMDGYRRWLDARLPRLSPGHLSGVESTMNKWAESFGVNSTIEGTSLPSFVEWIADQAKGTKGRGAQIRQTHLLTIARWCRSRGLVKSIPFEHAPKQEARLDKRPPAAISTFLEISKLLPPQMLWLWWMLGLTGMRVSAACTLMEKDIGQGAFTVTTKGNKRIEYPITPEIRVVIERAREWKQQQGFSSETLFCSHRGRPWVHYAFSEQLRKRASGYKVTPHQLRHMVGTIMAESNLSPDIIQAGLGHDDRSSAEVYIDQTAAMRGAALKVVPKALGVVDFLEIFDTKNDETDNTSTTPKEAKLNEDNEIVCPHCSCNIKIIK